MSSKRYSVPNYSIALLIIISLLVMAGSGHFPALWGMSHFKFLPDWWMFASMAVVFLAAIPTMGRRGILLLDQLSQWIYERSSRRIVAYSFSTMVFTALAIVFQQSIPLLGDGSLRANEIFDGRMWQPTEMLDFLTHALLYQHAFAPLGYSATTCYRVVSVISGLLFLFNALQLAKSIDVKRSALYFLLLSTSGMVVLFFGYIESYSLVAAYIPLLILLLIKTTEKKLHWSWAILAYLFGTLIHSIVLLLFAAPSIFAVLSHRAIETKGIKLVNGIIAISVLVVAIAGYVVSSNEGTAFSGYLLPLSTKNGTGQALLTSQHALNILNWLFFAALPFLFLLPGLLWKRLNSDFQTSPVTGLAWWLIISALLFIIFFRPQIGGPRDWDLFSLAAFCFIPAALVIHSSKWKDQTPPQIIPILVISGSLVLSLAIINSSPRRSVERFTEIIEVGKLGNLYIEYATLFKYAASYPELAERRVEFGRKAWEQPARTKQDSLYITQSLALYLLSEKDNKEAIRWIGRALKTDSTNLTTYKILIQYYEQVEDKQRLVTLAGHLESLYSTNADGLLEAGLIHIRQNITQTGGELIRRAFALDQSNLAVLINLGNYYNLVEKFDSASVIFAKATAVDTSSFAAAMGLATAQYFSGNVTAARQSLSIAETLVKNPEQEQKAAYLRQYLGR